MAGITFILAKGYNRVYNPYKDMWIEKPYETADQKEIGILCQQEGLIIDYGNQPTKKGGK